MKYQVTEHGQRVEALGACHGYRIRISTLKSSDPANWPVSVHVRGSESESEVKVDVPKRHLGSAAEALEFGYDCASLWIEAADHHGYL